MRKNQNELLLQKDALMFLLQREHLITPSNSTFDARLFATSEARFIALTVAISEQMCQVASTGTAL
jgi:hypothetical protein